MAFRQFDFTMRTAEPIPDGMLVYFTDGDALGLLPRRGYLMHLRRYGWLGQSYDYGSSGRGPAVTNTKLHVVGLKVPTRDF